MRRLTLSALVVLVALTGCQAPVTVLVAPEAAALRPWLDKNLARVEAQSGLRFLVVDESAAPADLGPVVLRIGTDNPGLAALDQRGAVDLRGLAGPYNLPPALVRQDRSLPLFWDLPGLTVFGPEAPAGSEPGVRSWQEPLAGWTRARTVVTAGAEAEIRLTAWLGAAGGDGGLPSEAQYRAYTAWLGQPFWLRDTWRFQRADYALSYQGGRGAAFLETFRAFFKANPPGFRRFFPLQGRGPSGAPVLTGTVLSLQAWGGEAARTAAGAWAGVLLARSTQEEFSRASGWMPASLHAAVLETASAQARQLLLAAGSFTATSHVTAAVRERLNLLLGQPGLLTAQTPAKE